MNDAGEVLLTLYERTMSVGQAAQGAVNAIFGPPVDEPAGPPRHPNGAGRVVQQAGTLLAGAAMLSSQLPASLAMLRLYGLVWEWKLLRLLRQMHS